MKELIQRHYEATRKRGCITADTDMKDFIEKMNEEFNEIEESYYKESFSDSINETVDLIAVCLNAIHHFGFDFEELYSKNVKHQESRII